MSMLKLALVADAVVELFHYFYDVRLPIFDAEVTRYYRVECFVKCCLEVYPFDGFSRYETT